MQRLLLTGVLVVIAQGSGTQIIVGTVIALCFLKVYDLFHPFNDDNIQRLRELCQWQIFAVFFLALLLKADFESVNRRALDAFLVIAVSTNVVADCIGLFYWFVSGRKSTDRDASIEDEKDISNPMVENDCFSKEAADDVAESGIPLCELKRLS